MDTEKKAYKVLIDVYDHHGDFTVSNLTLKIEADISDSCSNLKDEIEKVILESKILGGIPDWGVAEVVGVSSTIYVNIVELADNIASRIMDDRYKPRGEEWMEVNPTRRIKPELEDEFYNLYEEASDIIYNSRREGG